jgi:hypothetical protein
VNSYEHMHYDLVWANITLENVCENMLTHMHKAIHLVVSIFEQAVRRWRSCGSVSHWEMRNTDQTLVTKWPEGEGFTSGTAWSLTSTSGHFYRGTDAVVLMCRARVWRLLTYGDVIHSHASREEERANRTLGVSSQPWPDASDQYFHMVNPL